ncbi:MAG: phosphatase PAP2 family protein [Rhodobiaceae bacterium]|nr:phosphatase PAP2 family protein [Rhodobiaceae bacterium]
MNFILTWFQKKDEKIFYFIFNNLLLQSVWDNILKFISKTADGYLLLFILTYGFFSIEKYNHFIACCLLTVVIERSLYIILKKVLKRPRPFDKLKGIKSRIIPFDKFSFPSGHTACATVTTIIIFNYFPTFLLIPFVIWNISVGVSRVYLGVHYPSDIFFGFLVGYTSFNISRFIII